MDMQPKATLLYELPVGLKERVNLQMRLSLDKTSSIPFVWMNTLYTDYSKHFRMTPVRPLEVLFFDVFGTCVARRGPVVMELFTAAQRALESGANSIDTDVRKKASQMSYEQWDELGVQWNQESDTYVRQLREESENVDWVKVDKHRVEMLPKLLTHRGLIRLDEDSQPCELRVKNGSLWDASQIQHLGLVWHRLTPWPDTCRGLDMLNSKFTTAALSNTYQDLIHELVSHRSMPFTHVYSSDMFRSFKPNPKVYLGAAEKVGVKPDQCAFVAAHLDELKGAKACGFYTIYVERPLEEKDPELRGKVIPDLLITEDEHGFITLAERLGIQVPRVCQC